MISIFFIRYDVCAQIGSNYRLDDWKNAGYDRMEVEPDIYLDVKEFGAKGDGVTDDTEAIIDAISSLDSRHGTIFFPEGSYKITQSIKLQDSCVLIGEGSKRSLLLFDLRENNESCLQVAANPKESFNYLNESIQKGEKKIHLPAFHQFKQGDYIEIVQDNGDWDAVPADWASNSVGHLSEIVRLVGDTAWLKEGVRMDMELALNLRIRKITPIQHVKISCLGIERLDAATFGYQIYLKYANGVQITGLESRRSVGSHVMVEACRLVSICGNYFHEAFEYDGMSTHGYGVTLIRHTNLAKIENNIFRKLRHAMMVKQGANGNVFAYNFATKTYREEEPKDLSGDISLHGHYAYQNLFEGNIVNNIVIDHFWGPSGAGNTFFRNRTLNYGISTFNFNENSTATFGQVFIGNHVTERLLPRGAFLVDSLQNTTLANLVRGVVASPSDELLEDSSFYLNEAPTFWASQLPWPSIGPPASSFIFKIPAQYRDEQKDTLPICNCNLPADDLVIPTEPTTNILPPFAPTKTSDLELTSAFVHSHYLNTNIYSRRNTNISLKVFDVTGKQIFYTNFFHTQGSQTYSFSLPTSSSSGIYIISVEDGYNLTTRKFLKP